MDKGTEEEVRKVTVMKVLEDPIITQAVKEMMEALIELQIFCWKFKIT